MSLHAVIIAGGSGTRFWPESRRTLPKQFLRFEPHRSLITATSDRLGALVPKQNLWVVCGAAHAKLVERDLPQLPKENLLVEPKAKNTAPAIALANLHVHNKDPEAVVCVLPADHFIRDEQAFRTALEKAVAEAKRGGVVTLGITPNRAETGFGYIERNEEVGPGAYRVARFIEKPPQKDAEKYAASGKHFWNGGIFVFLAAEMQRLFGSLAKEIAEPLAQYEPGDAASLAQAFDKVPSISIDYAIAEKAPDMKVVALDCGWSDVGGWDALPEVLTEDGQKNVADADLLAIEAHGNIVKVPRGKRVCLVGVEDLIVVDTPDALLVMPRGQGQSVREVVAALEKLAPEKL
ncbi:MAG: mannose-1-phosphate guanylyltransferase [Deltaproteobacteria bacterium]|nr:mannose-1-phosphate guanylyltransferase [Deltaproteobacteria bacterium]